MQSLIARDNGDVLFGAVAEIAAHAAVKVQINQSRAYETPRGVDNALVGRKAWLKVACWHDAGHHGPLNTHVGFDEAFVGEYPPSSYKHSETSLLKSPEGLHACFKATTCREAFGIRVGFGEETRYAQPSSSGLSKRVAAFLKRFVAAVAPTA